MKLKFVEALVPYKGGGISIALDIFKLKQNFETLYTTLNRNQLPLFDSAFQ